MRELDGSSDLGAQLDAVDISAAQARQMVAGFDGELQRLRGGLQHVGGDLVERFESGGFASRDVLALLVAGLRGGGWQGTARDLLQAEIEGGPMAGAKAAAQLLVRAFQIPDADE